MNYDISGKKCQETVSVEMNQILQIDRINAT